MKQAVLIHTDRGLYCHAGDFFIDPWKPVDTAIITHAHSDHARYGMRRYITHNDTVPILRHRLGKDIVVSGVDYSTTITLGSANVSLHPAGHLIGSAQVRIEVDGEVWVVTGDYKRQDDPYAMPFEVVRCDTLVTECTFGVPIYKWPSNVLLAQQINSWWRNSLSQKRAAVLLCYALGKAQRILGMVDTSIGPIYTHGAIETVNTIFRDHGVGLPHTMRLSDIKDKETISNALVLAPSSAQNTPWMRRTGQHAIGIASGWMLVRGNRRRKAVDKGIALSDHVDWPDLVRTVRDTGAGRVLATHGYTAAFVRWLREEGYSADELHTQFGTDEDTGADNDTVESSDGEH